MNFYKRHLGDYARDTAHLSQGQVGAYDLLLDWYYANERPLPTDKADIYRIARAFTPVERKNVDKVLAFFTLTPDGYRQKRADVEIAAKARQSEINRETGKKGGRPRKHPNPEQNENRFGFDSETEREPIHNPSQNPESREEQKLSGETHAPSPPRAQARAREDHPGPDPEPTEAGRACRLMREAGCATANPANPNLLEALAEGVSPETLAQYAALAVANGKTSPFAYAIAAARGDHRQPPPGARHAHGTPSRRLSAVERVEANIRRARIERGELDPGDFIDGTATRVAR